MNDYSTKEKFRKNWETYRKNRLLTNVKRSYDMAVKESRKKRLIN